MAKFPDVEYEVIQNRAVPFTKPQHYKKGSTTDTELTGHDNPLPVANYTQNTSGIWLPTSESNPMPTRLTGSNVEDGLPVTEMSRIAEREKIADSISVEAGARLDLFFDYNGCDYITVGINIDKQPWKLRSNSIYRRVPDYSIAGVYPKPTEAEKKTYPSALFPKEFTFTGQPSDGLDTSFYNEFNNLKDAIDFVRRYDESGIRIENNSGEKATITVTITRNWR